MLLSYLMYKFLEIKTEFIFYSIFYSPKIVHGPNLVQFFNLVFEKNVNSMLMLALII